MEYDIGAFTRDLMKVIYESPKFPYMEGDYVDRHGRSQPDSKKHPKRTPTHLKQVVSSEMMNTLMIGETNAQFDLGSERLEREYPYYHILEDSLVIKKRGRATTQTKGSQMFVQDKGKRDYGIVYWNGKTFTKEYSKNVRGSRVNLGKVQQRHGDTFVNTGENQYLNIHYHYLENILGTGTFSPLESLAEKYGLKLMARTVDSGLIDDFAEQEGVSIDKVLEAFDSFM